MQTATDRLGPANDNRVEIIRHDSDTGAVRVRYIESGTESTIHASHLTDFRGTVENPTFKAGPVKAVPGSADPVDGKSNAHTQRIAPGVVQLTVRFMNGKRRSVGEYATHAEAQRAYRTGNYGF